MGTPPSPTSGPCGSRSTGSSPTPASPARSSTTSRSGGSPTRSRRGGQLQPIRVRHKPGTPGRYLIVAGERRWRAAKLAELPELDAILAVGGFAQTREPECSSPTRSPRTSPARTSP
ncbi:MAG: ParB N-terminal domain-containing protein [Isosphaeraceae bacterium]